ncbi:hypothetical protein F7725_003442 [Dissostichus mawsoni]|uniref:Dynamin N-terminal domain-containing protein n=1 Tax=Dissostichus mawsoni TaxID=36200 RepID=A0A7J5YAD2_DISMA|nr:hypothetical protein F7725_003442 [Dissostichus mawsoni]
MAVSIELEKKLSHELYKVREPVEETLTAFERCLSEGVGTSKSSCDKVLKSVLYPTKKGGAFHRILKCLVENGGIHKTKKGESININMKLTSCLTDSIDEEFKKTFPNEGNSGPFNGVINTFSLGTEKLTNKECENVKLQLTFLKTEEEKMKTNLNKLIRERKKTIYSSLTTTIEETMKECYDRAKEIRGEGSLKNMRETIEIHVHGSKNVMFAQAKDAMMKQLRDLKSEILEKLESTMKESIELSLKTDGVSIPDVSVELEMEEQNTTDPETSESSVEVCPSTSKTNDKRKLDLQGESSQSPARKRPREDIQGTKREEVILSDVKNTMSRVLKKLPDQDDKLNKFLKNNIKHLETDKREMVGVFGKTGAGKSSLINAIIGVKDLLPSGSISACTSVMIKVEANMRNPKYEAKIEFITKEEWKEELWTLNNFLGDNEDQEKDEDYEDSVEKLSVLYGEKWKNKSPENLLDKQYFKEIPEFSIPRAKELSAKLVKYTRSESNEEDAKDVKRWYWPLVKCVTVRVPNNRLLQHVTLVDLPGNGDRNKSRDRMWKKVIGSCSTVWIVAEINRAASEKEPGRS